MNPSEFIFERTLTKIIDFGFLSSLGVWRGGGGGWIKNGTFVIYYEVFKMLIHFCIISCPS